MKIKNIWIEDIRTTYVNQEETINNFTFIVVFQQGLVKKYYKFMTNFPYFKICYLQDRGFEVAPADREENRKILQLAYGELKKQLAVWELQADFREQDEEEKRKRKEEEQGKIKIGEQVSIEKYLKNFKKPIDNI